MENLTLINIILVLCGILVHAAMSLKTEVYEGKEKFNLIFFWKKNRIDIIVGVVTGFVALILAEPIIKTLGLYTGEDSPFMQFHAFFSGILGRGWIFAIVRRLKIDRNENKH